jgi:precorrin-6B methylase 2
VEYLWQQLKATWEWREIVHQEPPPTYGGFGVLRWKARTEIAALDPSPDGGRFALAREFREPPSEPVFDLQTPVGSLLVPEADRPITQEFFNGAVAEPATTAFLRSTLRAGQTFVDVGARLGYFSVLASRLVRPTGTVIAVEPDPRSVDLLRRNLVRNGCTNSLVVPFDAHRLVSQRDGRSTAWCVRLDDLLPARVDVVKIESHGYDDEVLEGLERTFAANPQLIVLTEFSIGRLQRRGVDPASALARYQALGYDLSVFDEAPHLRQVSPEQALAACRRIHPSSHLSVILSRAQKSGLSDGRTCPVKVEGLEVNETSDGLTIFHPARDRVHELNPTAAVVFELCTGENAVDTIIGLVQEAYGLPDPPAAEVSRCLKYLRVEGVVI